MRPIVSSPRSSECIPASGPSGRLKRAERGAIGRFFELKSSHTASRVCSGVSRHCFGPHTATTIAHDIDSCGSFMRTARKRHFRHDFYIYTTDVCHLAQCLA